METIDPVWLFGGIALVGGVLIGVLLLRVFNPVAGDVEKLQAELEQARNEMESYKASVNTHFNKTSDLVNELTQDYVKVYRHLAEGAQALSDTREFTQVLDQPQGQVLISVEAETDQPPDPDPLAVETDLPPDPDPLAVETDQPPVPVAQDVSDADADVEATASEQPPTAEEAPAAPTDYARVDENDTTTEEAVSVDSEDVADTLKEDDKDTAAVSADEATASVDDSASAVEAEQPTANASETDTTKKS